MFPFLSYSIYVVSFSLLLFSRPCFPARPSPGSTVLTADNVEATWHQFQKFLDASTGSHVTGLSELKKYFNRFGYLTVLDTNLTDDTFDDRLESAVIRYQSKLGLPVTGKIDLDTLSQIMLPRCGMSDTHVLHSTRHYAYFSGEPRWNRPSPINLSYAFSPDHMVSYLAASDVRAIFQRAFTRWAAVIPVSFYETDYVAANIKIGFYGGDHGDGQPFDGVLGVLAHAFSPESGRFHLDAAERWAVDFGMEKSKVAVDLESVATHEIGHVLGLGHSSVREAIMYPSLTPRTKKVDLKIDDVEGVQALYGSNPNFRFSSLLASDTSTNDAVGSRIRFSQHWPTALIFLILCLCI